MGGSLHLPEFGSAVSLHLSEFVSEVVQGFIELVTDPALIGATLFFGCGICSLFGFLALSDIVPERWEITTGVLAVVSCVAFFTLAIVYCVWRSEYGT